MIVKQPLERPVPTISPGAAGTASNPGRPGGPGGPGFPSGPVSPGSPYSITKSKQRHHGKHQLNPGN